MQASKQTGIFKEVFLKDEVVLQLLIIQVFRIQVHQDFSTCSYTNNSPHAMLKVTPPPQPSALKLHLCRKLLSKVQQKLLSQRKEPGAPVFCPKEKVLQTFMHFLRNAPLHFQKDRMMSAGSQLAHEKCPIASGHFRSPTENKTVNICAE